MSTRNIKTPFFARFVESSPNQVKTGLRSGADGKTSKYPSDYDEMTLKYPSDDDEYKGNW